jgi:hypothetical protein
VWHRRPCAVAARREDFSWNSLISAVCSMGHKVRTPRCTSLTPSGRLCGTGRTGLTSRRHHHNAGLRVASRRLWPARRAPTRDVSDAIKRDRFRPSLTRVLCFLLRDLARCSLVTMGCGDAIGRDWRVTTAGLASISIGLVDHEIKRNRSDIQTGDDELCHPQHLFLRERRSLDRRQ